MLLLLQEENDPFKNDKDEHIDPKFLSRLWDLGFFGSQVPIDLGGSGLNNTQLARLASIVGEYDLGLLSTKMIKPKLIFSCASRCRGYLGSASIDRI